jgi:pyrrolysyl-tRNA synthetase-like protein
MEGWSGTAGPLQLWQPGSIPGPFAIILNASFYPEVDRMPIIWTSSQSQRIRELGGEPNQNEEFPSEEAREKAFSVLIEKLQSQHRKLIRDLAANPRRHPLAELESSLAKMLVGKGFMEVKTPTIISYEALRKMGITKEHPLYEQVFWLDEKRCLRPMLAPNLYFLMRQLKRNVKMPLMLFEIGTCYRKESHGNSHLEEFTMLNLVEMKPDTDATERLKQHIVSVMDLIGLEYELVTAESEVYVSTIDVEVGGVEVASGAVGPHILDKAHGVTDPWAGVGFGLERLLLMKSGDLNIKKVGRSLIYLNGARIDI